MKCAVTGVRLTQRHQTSFGSQNEGGPSGAVVFSVVADGRCEYQPTPVCFSVLAKRDVCGHCRKSLGRGWLHPITRPTLIPCRSNQSWFVGNSKSLVSDLAQSQVDTAYTQYTNLDSLRFHICDSNVTDCHTTPNLYDWRFPSKNH